MTRRSEPRHHVDGVHPNTEQFYAVVEAMLRYTNRIDYDLLADRFRVSKSRVSCWLSALVELGRLKRLSNGGGYYEIVPKEPTAVVAAPIRPVIAANEPFIRPIPRSRLMAGRA